MEASDATIRHYVDLLASTFMVRVLPPWHENLSKRQVKAPKDLHPRQRHSARVARHRDHARAGAASQDRGVLGGFLCRIADRATGARPEQCYFWATHAGAELDLLVVAKGRRSGFEIKAHRFPARDTLYGKPLLDDLKLDLDVIHAGQDTFPLAHRSGQSASCVWVTLLRSSTRGTRVANSNWAGRIARRSRHQTKARPPCPGPNRPPRRPASPSPSAQHDFDCDYRFSSSLTS